MNFQDPTAQLQAQNFYYQQKAGMQGATAGAVSNPSSHNLLLPSIDTTKLMNQQSFIAPPTGTPAAGQQPHTMDHFYKI